MSQSAPQSRIPMLNIARQTASIRPALDAAIARVMDHGQFINGPEVRELEERMASYCGTRYAVACASGTDALLLPLMALGAGPGHRVITSPFTFFATAGSISRVGARPVFIDIDPATFNLDPAAVGRYLESLPADEIGTIKAIIPVHLFGQCARMDSINELAQHFGIPVIEDAAQAIGAEFQGQRAGALGHCATFSFFPSKNLGGAGDGGMITTDDESLAQKLRILKEHGGEQRYYHRVVGTNSRLDTLQAAILLAKFPHIDAWTNRRIANAAFYAEKLGQLSAKAIGLPVVSPSGRHVFNQFTIQVTNRDLVQQKLNEAGIASAIYYPVPLHLQECFAALGYLPGDLPHSERAAANVLSIPNDPELTAEERDQVALAVAAALQ
ncbi:MAG TPA: DegT/DnrJ/EryC1/StrS family aminotransferase [Bryobacteraceae bacterium]|nr:DegT/DnrJ/EryC1/StrS family aminotransferase [Bryobacteraceae bacterium]